MREFFLGTKEEQQAKQTIQRLQIKGRLTNKEKDTLQNTKLISARLDRRRFLSGIAATATVGVAAYYGIDLLNSKDEEKPIEPQPQPTHPQIPAAPEILIYYPEIYGSKLNGSGELQTDAGNIKWFNFSDAEFNPNAAIRISNFTYDIGFAGLSISNNIAGQERVTSTIIPRKPQTSILFFIDQNHPLPGWFPIQDAPSATNFRPNNQPNITFIKVPKQEGLKEIDLGLTQSLEGYLNEQLATQICHETIKVSDVVGNSFGLTQDIFCNTFGKALAARQAQITYEAYKSFTAENFFSFPLGVAKLYLLSEQQYNDLPVFEKGLKVKNYY